MINTARVRPITVSVASSGVSVSDRIPYEKGAVPFDLFLTKSASFSPKTPRTEWTENTFRDLYVGFIDVLILVL